MKKTMLAIALAATSVSALAATTAESTVRVTKDLQLNITADAMKTVPNTFIANTLLGGFTVTNDTGVPQKFRFTPSSGNMVNGGGNGVTVPAYTYGSNTIWVNATSDNLTWTNGKGFHTPNAVAPGGNVHIGLVSKKSENGIVTGAYQFTASVAAITD